MVALMGSVRIKIHRWFCRKMEGLWKAMELCYSSEGVMLITDDVDDIICKTETQEEMATLVVLSSSNRSRASNLV